MNELWNEDSNARAYHAYAERYSMYSDVTEFLLRLGGERQWKRAVDLACGTGVSTRVIADLTDAEVTGIDASAAMLRIAASYCPSPRVRWLHRSAEALSPADVEPQDLVVCNAALWQMQLPRVVANIAGMLDAGGVFVCSLANQHTALEIDEPDPSKPSLRGVIDTIVAGGFSLIDAGFLDYTREKHELQAFLSIPSIGRSMGKVSTDHTPGTRTVRWVGLAFRRESLRNR